MSTLTVLPGLTAYVVHRRDVTGNEVTLFVHAVSTSSALAASGLPSGTVHDAKFSACDACVRALAAEAVSR